MWKVWKTRLKVKPLKKFDTKFSHTCSYFWGVLADRRGRKPVIIASSICIAVCCLMFGFSINFAMVMIARFLIGFFNG